MNVESRRYRGDDSYLFFMQVRTRWIDIFSNMNACPFTRPWIRRLACQHDRAGFYERVIGRDKGHANFFCGYYEQQYPYYPKRMVGPSQAWSRTHCDQHSSNCSTNRKVPAFAYDVAIVEVGVVCLIWNLHNWGEASPIDCPAGKWGYQHCRIWCSCHGCAAKVQSSSIILKQTGGMSIHCFTQIT